MFPKTTHPSLLSLSWYCAVAIAMGLLLYLRQTLPGCSERRQDGRQFSSLVKDEITRPHVTPHLSPSACWDRLWPPVTLSGADLRWFLMF